MNSTETVMVEHKPTKVVVVEWIVAGVYAPINFLFELIRFFVFLVLRLVIKIVFNITITYE